MARRIQIGIGLVGVILLSTSGVAAPAAASASSTVAISVGSIDRDTATGFLEYSVTASGADYWDWGDVCQYPGYACRIGFQLRLASDGSSVTAEQSTISYPDAAASVVFTGSIDTTLVDGVRSFITGSSGTAYSAWTTVADAYVTPSASLDVSSVGRSKTTGYFTYSVSAASAAYYSTNGVCHLPGFACIIGLQAEYGPANSVINLEQTIISYPTPSMTPVYQSSIDLEQVTHLRSYVSGSGGSIIYSAWVAVSDPYFNPTAGLSVDTFRSNSSTGTIDYAVTAASAAYFSQNGVCRLPGWGCTIGVNVKYGPSDDVSTLDSSSIAYPTPATAQNFTGTTSLIGITAVQAYVSGHNGTVTSAWIPVSSAVDNGVDMAAAATLIAAGIGSGSAPCFTLFQFGTHVSESSLSDQEIECETALTGGQSLRDYLIQYAGVYGAVALAPLLVLAGDASNSRNEATTGVSVGPSGTVLPAGCSFTGVWTITCVSGATTTVIRDPSAPTLQDPVKSNNQLQKLLTNTPEGDLPASPTPVLIPGPLDDASPEQIALSYVQTCEQWVDTPTSGPSGTATTFGAIAGVDEDDCTTMPVFFSGKESPEATKHDREAIVSNPAWLRLNYASAAEKTAALQPRKSSWLGIGACAVYSAPDQCDEFPYYVTDQGYPSSNPPSLKPIPGLDNARQGGKLSSFFAKCSTFQTSSRGDSGREFLVIPLPDPLLTFTYCGSGSS